MQLNSEEHIEQAFFFEMFLERLEAGYSTQEILAASLNEILSSTKLLAAVDFLLTDMRHTGLLSPGMDKIRHYFTPLQAYIVAQTEKEGGRFDFRVALEILRREAKYKSENGTIQGIFFYQFEVLCRNRLGYDFGLEALAADPIYDEDWKSWIDMLRRQIGFMDLADLIFVRSENYKKKPGDADVPVLFGDREGRIAWATRGKDPTLLLAALSRHLGYPKVPRQRKASEEDNAIPMLKRSLVQVEQRLSLLEEELRGGINISRYYERGK